MNRRRLSLLLVPLVAAVVLFPRASAPQPGPQSSGNAYPGALIEGRTGAPSAQLGASDSEGNQVGMPFDSGVPVVLGSGAPTPRPSGGIDAGYYCSEPTCGYVEPTPKPRIVGGISGTSSWYDYVPGGAAAGPRLRAFLGPHWRGTIVRVCAGSACVVAQLSDWCGCNTGAEKLIDLDDRLFAALAPLSRGVVGVTVTVVE